MVVDSAGKIREIARVVPFGGVAAWPALLPMLLPAAAAAAASYYQHQALQATLDEILKVVDSIEERLRDDDWAVLEAGDELARTLIDGDGDWDGETDGDGEVGGVTEGDGDGFELPGVLPQICVLPAQSVMLEALTGAAPGADGRPWNDQSLV